MTDSEVPLDRLDSIQNTDRNKDDVQHIQQDKYFNTISEGQDVDIDKTTDELHEDSDNPSLQQDEDSSSTEIYSPIPDLQEEDCSNTANNQQDGDVSNAVQLHAANVQQDQDWDTTDQQRGYSSNGVAQQDSYSTKVDMQEDMDVEKTSEQYGMEFDKSNFGQVSETDSGSGGNQSQDSDSLLFPLPIDQGSSSNYLQDLKKRKMKMKKQSANIMKTNKLLKMIRQQSKFRTSQSDHVDSALLQAPILDDEGSEAGFPTPDVPASNTTFAEGFLGQWPSSQLQLAPIGVNNLFPLDSSYSFPLLDFAQSTLPLSSPELLVCNFTSLLDGVGSPVPMNVTSLPSNQNGGEVDLPVLDAQGPCATDEDGNPNTSMLYDTTGLFQCHLCPVAFVSPVSLRGHMSSHKIQKKYVCPICTRSFAHSSTLNYHIRKHKGDLRYKCDICGKRFLKPFRLKAHISCVHSGEKPYICSYCNKAFSCSINLTRHIRVHTGERPFLCLLCGKRFRDNSSFALHRRYHSKNRPYACEVCGKAFIKMHFLKTHKKCVHDDTKTHECFICSKTFKVKDYLRKHLLTHQENKRYKCDFCEKSFPRIGSLKKHRYLHTGEEPFKCDVCSKGFRDAYTLAKHKRLHERKIEDKKSATMDEAIDKKTKLFECDKCERRYSLSGSLKIHKQKYCKGVKESDEKKDPSVFCSGCGMLFHHKQSLAKHMKTTCEAIYGKKDKVFLCSTCGLVFFSKVTLNDHLRTSICSGKENPENYKCSVCNAEFSHRATLSKHKKLHSSDDIDAADEESKTADGTEVAVSRHSPLVDERGRRIFECKQCGERFRSKSALYDTHMRKCHDRPAQEKKNACEHCGRKFHSKSDLRAHIRIHTGEKPFTCGVCGKSFTQRGHVSMHMKIHTGQRDFPCTICGKAFQFATTLRNHVKIHTGERPHVCDLCGKGFIKYNNLKNHLAKHAKKDKKLKIKIEAAELELDQVMTFDQDESSVTVSPVKKTASGRMVAQARKATQGTRRSSRSSRGSSMRKLIEEEMNPVEQLDEVKVEPFDFEEESFESKFSSTQARDIIANLESADEQDGVAIDLKCPFCGEIADTAYDLATHIKSHTGDRPFMCKDCGKSFVLASHLRCHMQVHGKKQQEYRCLVCTEQFNSAKLLQDHMKCHKGDRPFGCYFCDKSYGTSQHLRRHVRSAHPDKIDIDMNMLHMPTNTLNDGNAEEEELDESGRRVFRCKFCDKIYLKNQHLLRHMRTSHPDFLDRGTDDTSDSIKEDSQNVPIKTEIVWDPETTSAEDTGNAEDKYSTPDSLKSTDSSADDGDNEARPSYSEGSVAQSSPGKSQERVYIPPQLREDFDETSESSENSDVESNGCHVSDASLSSKGAASDDQATDPNLHVEIKQEPTDSEYEATSA